MVLSEWPVIGAICCGVLPLSDSSVTVVPQRDGGAAQIVEVQLDGLIGTRQCDRLQARIGHRFIPQPSEITLLERLPGLRGQDQRRHALHAVEHPAQCDGAGYVNRRGERLAFARLALSQRDLVAIVGRPRQAQEVTLALSGVEAQDQCAL